jgi:hypothetical protein
MEIYNTTDELIEGIENIFENIRPFIGDCANELEVFRSIQNYCEQLIEFLEKEEHEE